MPYYDWEDRLTTDSKGLPCAARIVDAHTGKEVPEVVRCDTDSGWLMRLVFPRNGGNPKRILEERDIKVVPCEAVTP